MASHSYTARINQGGNFCGHYPDSPAFTLAKPAKKGKGGLPPVLTRCMKRLKDYYYRPGKVIPSLNSANSSGRQQRSERREACICLMAALLKRMDLVSLRVGIPCKDGFMNYTVDYIAKDTGMNLKRVERALKDLKTAGIITVSQPRQLMPDGSWKGLAAVKAISKHLFGAFGLAVALKEERKKASDRQKKKAQQWGQDTNKTPTTRTGKARFSLFGGALAGSIGNGSARNKSRYRKADPPDEAENRRRLLLKAAEIKQANMNWGRDKCYEEAEKQLSGAACL